MTGQELDLLCFNDKINGEINCPTWQEYSMLMVLNKLSYPYPALPFWLSSFNSAASF